MLINGLFLLIDRAVDDLDEPLVSRHRNALRLGSLREDVRRVPLLNVVYEHWSFTHLTGRRLPGGFLPLVWLGPGTMADRHFDRAVAEARAGRWAAAFVKLGRAAHLLSDMACPVHANRVIHETDPYEWYVETHVAELAALPLPAAPRFSRPSELIESMAGRTREFEPDMTHSFHGRLMKRWGLRKSLTKETIERQARAIMPGAAAHMKALIELFLREAGQAPRV